ncbi:MAG: amino acid racemase [Hyphomonadaceae bacterium]|nr:amino acid racemase [Hyphomonadaceae bacterium]
MKTIGLIGGVSTEATLIYYKTINALVRQRLGGYHSAELRIHSVNFHDYNGAHETRDWAFIRDGFETAARGLKAAGADFLVLACNTLHTVADAIENATDLPFLHIVDACGARLQRDGRTQPGLLGTAYTMAQPYFVDRLVETTGMSPHLPDAETQTELSRIIFDDLTHGIVRDEAVLFYEAAIQALKDQGCDSIILGCTELGMLVTEQNSPLPPYDTALIHCQAIVDYALEDQ